MNDIELSEAVVAARGPASMLSTRTSSTVKWLPGKSSSLSWTASST